MADDPRRQFSRGKSARVILTEEADRMRASSAGGDESLRESSVMIDENLLATCDALTDAELAPLARAYEEDKLNFAIRKLLTARGLVDGEGGAARIVQARAIDIRVPQDSGGGGEGGGALACPRSLARDSALLAVRSLVVVGPPRLGCCDDATHSMAVHALTRSRCRLLIGGCWLLVRLGWWLVVGGWSLVVGRWWLVGHLGGWVGGSTLAGPRAARGAHQ